MSQIISKLNINEAQKLVQKAKKENKWPILIQAQNTEFNRKILEYGKFDVLLSPEKHTERHKDVARQLDSGLNEIMARIAEKNKIAIGINLEDIKKLGKKEKAQRLARIAQNLKICNKTKTKLAINAKDSKRDAASLLINLGASTQQAQEAIYYE